MVSIKSFVENKIGKRVDQWGWNTREDTYYTVTNKRGEEIKCWYYQCASLIYVYVREVFWVELWSFWGWAMDWYNKKSTFPEKYFDFYDKNWFTPRRWDIIFFKKDPKNYGYWHIWIILSAKWWQIYYLDQNSWKWRGFWRNGDQISIRKIWEKYNFSEVVWFARYKKISEKLNEDFFDKVVFENNVYLWEWKGEVYNKDVAERAFITLASGKKFVDYKNIFSEKDVAKRQDLVNIIFKILTKVLNKNISIWDLKVKWIWNWQKPDAYLTNYEFTFMVNKAKEVFSL